MQQQHSPYNSFGSSYQAQQVRGLSTQPYADTPPPLSAPGVAAPQTPGNNVNMGMGVGVGLGGAPFGLYGNGAVGNGLGGGASLGSNTIVGSLGVGIGGMGGVSGVGINNGSMSALSGALSSAALGGVGVNVGLQHLAQQEESSKIYNLVIELMDVSTREAALLELSKKREQYDDLALVLWHSFGE